jgi:hypothetical protein
MADANTVIQALGGQLAEALIAKTIAEVEVGEMDGDYCTYSLVATADGSEA